MDEKALFTKFWTDETKTTSKVLARIPTDTEPHGLNYFPSSRGTRSLGHNGVYLLD